MEMTRRNWFVALLAPFVVRMTRPFARNVAKPTMDAYQDVVSVDNASVREVLRDPSHPLHGCLWAVKPEHYEVALRNLRLHHG